jgi:single-strand DNA-binding protein
MINRVVVVGNLTRDPMFSKISTGTSKVMFTIAVNRKFKDQEQTDYVPCVAWAQSADYMNQYAKKGNMIAIEGRVTSRSYDDKDGRKVYVTEINCDSVQLIRTGTSPAPQNAGTNYQPSQQAPKAATGYFPDEGQVNDDDFNTGPLLDISSDDLPF